MFEVYEEMCLISLPLYTYCNRIHCLNFCRFFKSKDEFVALIISVNYILDKTLYKFKVAVLLMDAQTSHWV